LGPVQSSGQKKSYPPNIAAPEQDTCNWSDNIEYYVHPGLFSGVIRHPFEAFVEEWPKQYTRGATFWMIKIKK
jgi:hypothetical protein